MKKYEITSIPRAVILLIAILFLMAGPFPKASAATYNVSQSSGNDESDGKSPATAWKTLARASRQSYVPGDSILLKCGDTWDEVLRPEGEGTAASPITIGSYGEGARPLIDRQWYTGENISLYGIHLKNTGGYKIKGIAFAGCGRGIYVDLDKGVHNKEYLWVEDCLFRDSFYYNCPGWEEGSNYVFATGVMVHTRETSGDICFSHITIANCTFQRFAVAVNLWSGNEWDKHADNKFAFKDLTITHCTAEGAVNWPFTIHSTVGGTIADSWVHEVGNCDTPKPNGVAGALLFRTKDITVQDCEFGYVFRIKGGDGQAFDYEGNCTQILARNCLYHDTEGPGFLMCWGASSNAKAANVECLFENCVFNCKVSKAGNCTIQNQRGNTATFRNCRFYLRDGEVLASDMHGLTFVDCTVGHIDDYGGPNLAVGAKASASSSDSDGEAAKAVDGKESTAWRLGVGTPGPQWLELDFGSPRPVNEFNVRESTSSSISRYAIQYWDGEKKAWRNGFNGRGIGPAFVAPIVPVTTQKVRLLIHTTAEGSPSIDEFEVRNSILTGASARTWITVNDNSPSVVYRGAWEVHKASGHHEGDEHFSKRDGDTAEFTFKGTAIKVLGSVSNTRGTADVYVDGVLQRTIDTYRSPRYQQTIFRKTGLSSGKHTIRIVVKGEKNPNASDSFVDIDAFQYVAEETQ